MEEKLDDIYECLEDEEFHATYKVAWNSSSSRQCIFAYTMVTGKERSVLEIQDSDMEAKLKKIRRQVKESDKLAKKKVWKAITGPEDGYKYYWLWVKLKEDLKEEKSWLLCGQSGGILQGKMAWRLWCRSKHWGQKKLKGCETSEPDQVNTVPHV